MRRALAAEARKGVNVEMPAGLRAQAVGLGSAHRRSRRPRIRREPGTLYATSTSRNNMPLDIRGHPTWVPTVHTLKTVAEPARVLPQGAGAGAQRAEPVAARPQQGRLARHSRPRRAEGAALPHPGHRRRRHRRHVADHDGRIQRRPDLRRRRRPAAATAAICSSAWRPACGGSRTTTATARSIARSRSATATARTRRSAATASRA